MRRVWELIREHPLVVAVVVLVAAYQVFGGALPSIDLQKALDSVSSTLGKWTYAVVGALAFLETGAFVGLVFPGETAVILAGAIAGQGTTSIVLTIGIVWFAAWAGDTASFFIGQRLGREFILKHGDRVRITPERFEQVESYFGRYGGRTILIGRFIGLVRALAPFIAGSSGMGYRAFVPYSVLGTGMWAAAFSLLGYFLASNLDKAESLASTGLFYFGATVALLVGGYVAIRFMRMSENRSKLARRLEEHRLGKPVLAFGRRIEPHARFLWQRLTPGGLGLEFTTLMAVLAVAAFIVVAYGVTVADQPLATTGDLTAFDVAGDLRADWLTSVAKVVTALGSGWATVGVALVAAVVLAMRRAWPELAVLVGGVVLIHAGVPVLKDMLDRPRPAGPLAGADGSSWPSGHSANAIVYPWIGLAIALRAKPGFAHSTAAIVVGVVLAAAIGLSRVYLRVHFLSDVTSGAAFGVAAFALCAAVALLVVHFRENDEQS